MSEELEAGKPFSDVIRIFLANGFTYAQLQDMCGGVRSASWFRDLVTNMGVWPVGPPTPECIVPFARMFEKDEGELREWIAEEWFGVPPPSELSPRVRFLSAVLEELSDNDLALVRALANRLAATPDPL